MALSSQLEIEKLTALGKDLGLQGQELFDFIKAERAEIKAQRDEERAARAIEREAEKEKREHEQRMRKQELDFEREKQQYEIQRANEERDFKREQAAKEEAHKELEYKRSLDEFKRKEKQADDALSREETTLDKQIAIEEAKVRQAELNKNSKANVTKVGTRSKVPRLPSFDESKDNIDAYLMRFERYAIVQGWPKEHWAVDLSALLTGKGLEVYYSLNETQASDYNYLKKAILNRYELNDEGFRKKFRGCKPEEGESGVQYAHRLQKYFDRWIELSKVEDTREGVIDFIVRDQFLHTVPREMSMFIREREPEDIDTVAELADQYLKAHRSWWGSNNAQKGKHPKHSGSKKPNSNNSGSSKTESSGKSGQDRSKPKPKGKCYICDKPGHHAKDCFKRATLANALSSVEKNSPDTPDNTNDGDKIAFLMMTSDQSNGLFPGHNVYTLDEGQELPVMTAACHPQQDKDMYVVDGLAISCPIPRSILAPLAY